jgi:4-amino-4-deoxy-L-arabinose transferase-like glycosyltransferase
VGRPLASPAPADPDVAEQRDEEVVPPTPARTGGGGNAGRLVRTYWPLVALAAAAGAIALLSRHHLYPALSWNRDEPVYLWQMETLRAGHFTTPDGGFPQFFHPWLSAARDGELFSHFTLGWPLALLAGDLLFGSPDAALALGAVLTVLGTYALARELTRDHGLSVVAAAVMTASPVLLAQGGVYLSYLFTAGLGLLFTAGLLSGVRRGRPLRIVGAGALVGWIFLTRPYDAVLWGVGATAYLVWTRRRQLGTLLPAAGWLALGAAPFVLFSLGYNKAIAGSPLSFPNTASDPLDTFGFGKHRIMPGFGRVEFGPSEALQGTGKNVKAFSTFLFGGALGVFVAAAGIWRVRHDRRLLPLLAISVVFPLGYLTFWGVHVSSLTAFLSAPIYYIPLYATASILMAVTLRGVWRRRRAFAVGLVVVLAAATVYDASGELGTNRRISRAQRGLQAAPPAGRALVFVEDSGRYLLFTNPFVANDPELDGRVLYAVDRGPENLELIRAMPDRTPYSQRLSGPSDELLPRLRPKTLDMSYERLRVLRGDSLSLRVRVTNTVGREAVVVGLTVGKRSVWRTLDTRSHLGDTYETTFTVSTEDGTDLRLDEGADRLAVTAGIAEDPTWARKFPRAQARYDFEVRDGVVEALDPGDLLRFEKSRNRRRFVPAERVPELDVEASAAGAGG